MKIISTNIANLTENKKALYRLTKSGGTNVKDLEPNKSHPVSAYALYEDTKETKDGPKEQRVLAVVLEDDTKLQTISPTFIDDFMEIVDIMQDDPFAIITRKSVSKAGREFVYCELDCDWNCFM